MDPGSQGVQGCPSPGMAERGEGNGGCNRGDGLPPVPGTPSQQGSDHKDLGWMDKHLKQIPCPSSSSSHSNNKQMCHRMYRDVRARQTWMQVVKGIRCRMSTRKHARNARTGTSMVWCAMDSPTANVYAAKCASACTEFWLCEYAWWTKVWLCSKLRSEPDELPRKHAEWPSWSEFGRFDTSSGADPRGHGHVR